MNLTHRHAFLRYIVIDECLVQPVKDSEDAASGKSEEESLWYKEDLLAAINQRISAFSPHAKPIAMRTLEKDLVDMQSLFGVEILKLSQNRRAHYRYAKSGMSIRKASLTADQAIALQQLFRHLESLNYQEGEEWWWEAESRLRLHFDLFQDDEKDRKSARRRNDRAAESVHKSHRWSDSSAKWLPHLTKAAAKNIPIRLAYRLKADGALEHATCRIEWLTQENEEWLIGLLAWDEEAQEAFRLLLSTRSVDSMDDVTAQFSESLQNPVAWSWVRYASERMGLAPGIVASAVASPEPVQIWLESEVAKRFLIDPIHPSQDLRLQQSAGGVIFTINVVVDSSLFKWVLQWGKRAQLIEPAEARHTMRLEARSLAALYDPMFGP